MPIAYIYNQNQKKLFNVIKAEEFDNNYIYKLNNNNKNTIKRLNRKLLKKHINNIVVTDNLSKLLTQYNVINEKRIMEYMVIDILKYILDLQNKNMEQEDIYMFIKDDKKIFVENIEIMSNYFKTINIITSNINKFQKIAEHISKKNESIIYVSNNKDKGLRRANYIINFDMNNDELKQYNLKRKCILINLADEIVFKNKIFDGILVENIDIDFSDQIREYFKDMIEHFSKSQLYVSIINSKQKLKEIIKRIRWDNVRILTLLGHSGQISKNEILKILDKS